MAGNNGDYYLNLTSGDVFQKISGTWNKIGNIKGPAGPLITTSKVRAFQSVAQSINANVYTKVNLQTVMFDTLGEFSNNRFTAKQAGYYLIIGAIGYYVSGVTNGWVDIFKNGVVATKGSIYSNLRNPLVSDLIYLNQGDYVELYAYSFQNDSFYPDSSVTYIAITRVL